MASEKFEASQPPLKNNISASSNINFLPLNNIQYELLNKNQAINDKFHGLQPAIPLAKTVSQASTLEKTAALISYSCASICMTVTNRFVFSARGMHINCMLLLAQSLITVLLLWTFRLLGLVSFQRLSFSNTTRWFHVVVLLVGMLFSSSKGLSYLNVANFTVCKNIMIVFMAAADVWIFGGRVNGLMMLSFALVIGGSVMGCASDLNFSPLGYAWLGVNCLCTGGYLVEMRRCIAKIGFQDFDTVYYNNLLSIPLLAVLSVVADDWKVFLGTYWGDNAPLVGKRNAFLIGVLIGCFAAFAIGFASAWCLRILSSTTYSIAGSLNKLPVSISGLVFFPSERNFSVGNLGSIALSFVGGLVYTCGQLQLKRSKSCTAFPRSGGTLNAATINPMMMEKSDVNKAI